MSAMMTQSMRWAVVILLVTASCTTPQPNGAGSARNALVVRVPELRLDLRPPEESLRTSEIEELSLEPSHPDTTADGFLGWLSNLPDSMKATVRRTDRAVRIVVYADKAMGALDLSVHGLKGPIRRVALREDARSPQSWVWDICDSSHRRVAPGLYEVHVSNRIGTRIGYLLVR